MDYSKLSDATLKALKEGKSLDYSKLSNDELVELNKIAKNPIQQQSEPEEQGPSQLESFGRGAAQGASFGFADEATGLLESLLSNKSYEQARDESRAAYKAAEEANPMTSLAGNLAGGFVIPVPGMGSAKTLGQLAKQGAKYGALGALGTTETDITNPDIVKDIATGGLIGGVAGGAIGGIGKGLSKAGKALPETTIGKSFKYGLEGQELLGQKAREAVGRELVEQTGKSAEEIQSMIQKLSDEQVAILKQATESGQKINLDKFIDDFFVPQMEDLPKSFMQETDTARKSLEEPLRRIVEEGSTDVSPKDFNALKKAYGNMAYVKDIKDPDAKRVAKLLSGKTSDILEKEVPGIDKINSDIKNLLSAQEMFNVGKGIDDLGNEIALTPLIQRLESDTVSSDIARAKFDKAIESIKQVDPDKAVKIQNELSNISDKFNVAKEINKPGSFTVNPLELTRRYGAKIANPMGLAISKAKDTPISKVANTVFNAKPEALMALGAKLEAKGSKFAPVVKKLATEDTSKRNALMFTLMQQPAFREAIESEKEDGE